MALGLMTRGAHQREVVRMMEAYRWEIDRERERIAAKERKLDRMLDDLVRADVNRYVQSAGGYQPRIVLDVSDPFVTRLGMQEPEFYQRLAQRIVERLMGLHRDRRADMRAVANGAPAANLLA